MKRLQGVLALLGLLVIVVGMPVLLVAVADIGMPHFGWSLEGLWRALLSPDDGTLMLTLFKVAGWVAWAILTFAVLVEVAARARHLPVPQIRGFRLPQLMARNLVAAAAVVFMAAGTVGVSAAPAAAQPTPAPVATHATHAPKVTPQPAQHHAGDRAKTYTVHKGDTLSEIALKQTGKASAYPKLMEASRHTVQPGGRHLVDADVILPGWKITIPTSSKPAAQPKTVHTPDQDRATVPEGHGTPVEPEQIPAVPSTTQATPEATAPVDTVSGSSLSTQETATPAEDDGELSPAWLLCGLAGAGSLLAGALWLSLRRRRAAQFRSRRPGRSVSAPPPELAPVEKTLMHEGAPTGSLVVFIDEVLRRMAASFTAAGQPVPALVGMDVAETRVTIRLATPTQMAAPWHPLDGADGQVWRVQRDIDMDELGPLEADSPPPWPQLVTLGWDSQGWRLVNLESLGVVSITGDPVYGADLARYIVSELAVSPWSRDVEVDCLSICPELPGLAPARVRYHDADGVIADTIAAGVATVDRLAEAGNSSLETARTTQAGEELWDSRVLVSAVSRAENLEVLESLLLDNAGHTATSLLLVDANMEPTGVEMRLGSNGRVTIPALGLDLVVNGLTEAEARGCVAVLAAGEDLVDVEIPVVEDPQEEWQTYCKVDGSLRQELTVPRGTVTVVESSSLLPAGDEVYLAQTANTAEDLAMMAPLVPATVREQIEAVDPTLDADLEDWFSDSSPRPRLQVLGPIKVRVGPGGDPAKASARVSYYTELVAYLATMPGGATTEEVADALGIGALRVRKDIVVVRSWLGINPVTGEPFLPKATTSPQAIERGVGLYLVDDLLCDADLFRRLRMRGEARGADGLEDLRRALRLVNGVPYDDMRARGGIWLAETRDDQHLLCAIVDVAHMVSTIALGGGDVKQARAAAEVAALAAPSEATPQLDLAAVAAREGDRGKAAEIARGVVSWRDGSGEPPLDLSRRTDAILRAHRWLEEGATKAS